MIPFAGVIVMAVVGYLVYRWAMFATTRFFQLAVGRGQLQPRRLTRRSGDSLTSFLVRSGEWFDGLRAVVRPSADHDVEAARKKALRRWILAPVAVTLAGVITWVSLFAIVR